MILSNFVYLVLGVNHKSELVWRVLGVILSQNCTYHYDLSNRWFPWDLFLCRQLVFYPLMEVHTGAYLVWYLVGYEHALIVTLFFYTDHRCRIYVLFSTLHLSLCKKIVFLSFDETGSYSVWYENVDINFPNGQVPLELLPLFQVIDRKYTWQMSGGILSIASN